MPTFYVKPVGTVSAGGNGQTEATAFNGFSDLQSRGLALTASGDTIQFIGTFTISEFSYNTHSFTITQAIPGNWLTGPVFGSNQVASSTASGRIFDFRGSTVDMRGATTTAQRMNAALIIRGEGITVRGGTFISPNWNYLFNADGSTRVSGVDANTLAEQVSWENGGLIVAGCGNTVDGVTVQGTGTSGWCRFGLTMYVSNSGMAGATAGLTNTIKNCVITGALTAISVQAFGVGGYLIPAGNRVRVHSNRVMDPVWGWPEGFVRDEYNAGAHGNGIEFQLQGNGLTDAYWNTITGNFQDGLEFAAAGQCNGYQNLIYDIGDSQIKKWQWSTGTSRWSLVTASNSEGNGIKMGLGFEGTGHVAPSTWLGSDGTAGSTNLFLKESNNRVWGNVILRCNQQGITSNSSKGCYIHANEIIDCKGHGINLFSSSAGNHCVTNNYIRLSDSAANTSACVNLQANQRLILINNILDSGTNTTCNDLFVSATGTSMLAKTHNVYVRNRIGGSPAADTTAITSPGSLSWTQGTGLASGHAYYSSGKPDADLTTKIGRNRFDAKGHPLNKAIGPYTENPSRTARS